MEMILGEAWFVEGEIEICSTIYYATCQVFYRLGQYEGFIEYSDEKMQSEGTWEHINFVYRKEDIDPDDVEGDIQSEIYLAIMEDIEDGKI